MRAGVLLRLKCKVVTYLFFFFFKQKTAYEMLRSLVGSEMCIRDRLHPLAIAAYVFESKKNQLLRMDLDLDLSGSPFPCLLYTSDAADDLLCVDLGGRRIIKKKKY